MIALVKFTRGSFSNTYSYKTDIQGLKKGDLVLVQAQESYSLAVFEEYTNIKKYERMATKYIVANLQNTIDEFQLLN